MTIALFLTVTLALMLWYSWGYRVGYAKGVEETERRAIAVAHVACGPVTATVLEEALQESEGRGAAN